MTVELHPDRIDGDRMHLAGLYAYCTECPEQGSAFLGHIEVQEGDDDRATRVETVPKASPDVEEAFVSRFDFFLNTHGIALGRDAARAALAHILDGRP